MFNNTRGLVASRSRRCLAALCITSAMAFVPEAASGQPAPPVSASPSIPHTAPGDSVRETLSQFGTFVQHAKYGEVWTPTVTPPGWHPYEACHWVNTRQFGWYFDDKRPWGQIVHHYGRWTHDDAMGWIWVPGVEFSPGWVVWRSSPQWIGWAPQLPDEDLTTISADQFNNGGFWTFLDVNKFDQGCTGEQVVAAPQIPVILQQTQFVTEIDRVNDIAIFVLPNYIVGPLVDVDVAFIPWTPAFYFQLMIDLNAVFNELDVVVSVNFVDCTKPPGARPAAYTPAPRLNPAPLPLPPAIASPPAPPVVQNRCADDSLPPCRSPSSPVACPRGSHFEGTGCTANFTPPCPDGTPRDAFGRCTAGPPQFLCTNGAPPNAVTGSCAPAIVSQNCQRPLILRNNLCVLADPAPPPPPLCPNGITRDPRSGECSSVAVNTCPPPRLIVGGVCTDRSASPSCLPPRTMSNGQCVDRVFVTPACLPPRTMVAGQCADRVVQASCPPPLALRGGQCVSPVPVPPACAPLKSMIDGRCAAAVVQRGDQSPATRGPNGPFEGAIRHPTYGYGQNGNFALGATARPPAMPVLQRSPSPTAAVPPPTPGPGPKMTAVLSNPSMGGARPPIVLSRGGGGQNMFNANVVNGNARMAAPQPAMHQMPSPAASGLNTPRGGGGLMPQIR